jgi:uncharacterized protein (TIGR02270 family)
VATSIRQFNIELCQEHLDEASFLHQQRLAHLHDPEVSWVDLGALEERLEAHLDGLIVGGDVALQLCRQVDVGDPGAVAAALSVLCRRELRTDVLTLIEAIDAADQNAVTAAADTLCREAPAKWQAELSDQHRGSRAAIWARVIGYRRFPLADALHAMPTTAPAPVQRELAWALGRVGSKRSLSVLSSLLDADDESVCEAAAVAMLRLGDDRPIQRALDAAADHAWARRVLGIGGPPRAVPVLLEVLKSVEDRDTVLALGLLGHLSAVAPLLVLLEREELKHVVAVALNAITGANLYANVFVPDPIAPDELLDEEREAYERDGTLPSKGGQPYGNWERQPLTDSQSWHSWLDQHKHRFRRDLRWRNGSPYGPSALLSCLRSEMTPHALRGASYEELVVRYGLDVPFESDLYVHQQLRFLAKIDSWVDANAGRFEGGRWYLAGRLEG